MNRFEMDGTVLVKFHEVEEHFCFEDELEGVTEIGPRAFSDCINGWLIKLPDSVTVIGDEAFATEAPIHFEGRPEKLEVIGDRAFQGLNLYWPLPPTVRQVGEDAFSNQLKGLLGRSNGRLLPLGVTVVPKGMYFDLGDDSDTIWVPDTATTIRSGAFRNVHCHVDLPASITEIEEGAFVDCDRLTVSAFPGSYAWNWAEEHGVECYELFQGYHKLLEQYWEAQAEPWEKPYWLLDD